MATRREIAVLRYKLVTDDSLEFNTPEPVTWETVQCRIVLANDVASCQMRLAVATLAEAQQIVDPLLRKWQVWCSLVQPGWNIAFEFQDYDTRTVEFDDSDGQVTVGVNHGLRLGHSASVTIIHRPNRYPDPPIEFEMPSEVNAMWNLFQRYKEGRDRLLPMAYSCYHLVLYMTRENEKSSAKRLAISHKVLKEIRRLSSTRGDAEAARKIRSADELRDLSLQEIHWIEQAIQLLIRRTGEYAAKPDAVLPKLSKSDLPRLS